MIFSDELQKGFSWPDSAVYLLIDLYREKEEEFISGFKRHNIFWTEIATAMKQTNPKYNLSGLQCSNKWAGLKRTYKNISDQNKRSGNCRNSWVFFSVIIHFINIDIFNAVLTLKWLFLHCVCFSAYILIIIKKYIFPFIL